MAVTLETVDKVVGLPEIPGPDLTFSLDHVTAREIVSARVRAECARVAAGTSSIFSAPVVPAEREVLLNGPRKAVSASPDVDGQIAVALDAVECGRVIVLFNGAQVHDLDETLPLSSSSKATFLRLVPLAGG